MFRAIVSTVCELAMLAAFATAAFLAGGIVAVLIVAGAELGLAGWLLEPLPPLTGRRRLKRRAKA